MIWSGLKQKSFLLFLFVCFFKP